MDKERAIVLIQAVKKGLSKEQIIRLIGAEVEAAAGLLTEEAAIYLVLKSLGIGAPTPGVAPEAPKAAPWSMSETFAERKARMEAEPDTSGTYLKADKVQVGDMVRITAVALEAAKTISTARGPVDLPARPQVTGEFKAKGGKDWGQEVKFSLSKGNEKNLYSLWEKPLDECVGLILMVASIQRKNIGGNEAMWVEWTGILPS